LKNKTSYKTNFKAATFLLLLSVFLIQRSFAQTVLLDSLVLDTLTSYTSIEEAMKNPEKVIKLELRRKKLKTFPMEIFKFPNLQYLDLSKNSIKEIPPEISQLKNLQYLSISKNGLEELPPQIGDLTNLYYFNANQNELSSLPATVGKLTKLRNFDLWSNNIDKFPDEIKNMKSLLVLDLRVILIPDIQQNNIQAMLPNTKVYFSPYCKCQQ
jgi:Leucine-rich repeat (LRR) protein